MSYENDSPSWDSPFSGAAEVTPHDDNNLAVDARSLYIGGAGSIRVTTVGGNTVTFANHPVGYFPGRARRVHATGTTATNIVALW